MTTRQPTPIPVNDAATAWDVGGAVGSPVVIVHSSDEMYGADRMVLQVAATLSELGRHVEVWLPDDLPHGRFRLCERLDALGFTSQHVSLPILRRARLRPGRLPRLALDWARTVWRLRRARPGAVYLASSACLLVGVAARLAGVHSRILHIQEGWTESDARFLRPLARSATSAIAISQHVADAADLPGTDVTVVPNGVEDASRRVAASEPPDDSVPLTVVVASRWNRWKGHATLVRAWDLAGCPGRLVVLGGAPPTGDGVDVPSLVNAIVSDPDSVDVVGEVDDIAPYVARADVVAIPSDEPEPFGLVTIEAFSLGRPVIASRAGGPAEVIDDGVSGWLFELGDADDLAGLLRRLRRTDTVTAGKQARQAYERWYAPERYRQSLGAAIVADLERSAPR